MAWSREEIITAEELADRPETDDHEELVRGSIVREPPPGYGHGSMQLRIGALLDDWVRQRGLGEVVTETGFVLSRGPDTVRAPDVAFVAKDRVPGPAERSGYFQGAPDLAVEVRSPSDDDRAMKEKAREYLAAGSRMVWVVDPETETVTVHRPDAPPRGIDRRGMLDGGEVVPGFAVLAARILR